ncbi:class I SAM-dependent methyltransferase [Luteimonas sp. R10]|uniref:class I SAM-dependent methyltransferase n=1 Tax=Luteimonas sp. R10 TaxID=3108176 RepID=UPI00308B0144|nr:methyltransferase domain-containing protein [Luteimonas sp. R10]
MSSERAEPEFSQDLIGKAIADYRAGDEQASFELVREDGHVRTVLISDLCEHQALAPIGRAALNLCIGRVLDVGAGLGRYSRNLREIGLSVTPLDPSEECVDFLKEIGFDNAIHADLTAPSRERYDTILMLGSNLGELGTIERLGAFLASLEGRLTEGGVLICDSTDIYRSANPPSPEHRERSRASGRPEGYLEYQVRVEGEVGPPSGRLHIAETDLGRLANAMGLKFDVAFRDDQARYLAIISRGGDGQSSRMYDVVKRAGTDDLRIDRRMQGGSKTHAIAAKEMNSAADYVVIRNLVSRDVAALIHRYALLHLKAGGHFMLDGQSCCPSRYADGCGEALLELLKPQFEEVIGETLEPSYSYLRFYTNGAVLERHIDRPACEISATITIGYSAEQAWPIFIEVDGDPIGVDLEVGDALLYQGIQVPHWRQAFGGQYWLQLFLHYVRSTGEHFRHAFDGRGSIGPWRG